MIIPIEIEEDLAVVGLGQQTPQVRVVPIVTFPPELPEKNTSSVSKREKSFGDILIPALSKYFHLRDSKRKDFQSLLSKEHPLLLENFENKGDKYELQLNVQKFKPEELHVKINDTSISILGKHEEKTDRHNFSRLEFLRRYSLPNEVCADDIKCELSSDGFLLISAPALEERVKITEVAVPLEHGGTTKSI